MITTKALKDALETLGKAITSCPKGPKCSTYPAHQACKHLDHADTWKQGWRLELPLHLLCDYKSWSCTDITHRKETSCAKYHEHHQEAKEAEYIRALARHSEFSVCETTLQQEHFKSFHAETEEEKRYLLAVVKSKDASELPGAKLIANTQKTNGSTATMPRKCCWLVLVRNFRRRTR